MSVLRRRLLMGGGRWRYVDDFASLSGRWVAQAGSLAVSGGALQAATLGDWGPDIVLSGNMETGDPPSGWTVRGGATTSIVVDERTGGSGTKSLNAARGDSSDAAVSCTRPALYGASYHASAWYRVVDAASVRFGVGRNYVTFEFMDTGAQTNTDWSMSEDTFVSNQVALDFHMHITDTPGDNARLDDVYCYRRNSPALLAGWRSPNHVATLAHVSPTTGVVPFGYLCRYTDALNYWEVRVLPNTAGNDLQIVQVTAGVETVRAEADIDWTSGDTDELEVTCAGSTISTAYRKSGASVWTAGPSYASATQGQTSPNVGVMLYEASVGRLSGFEIQAI